MKKISLMIFAVLCLSQPLLADTAICRGEVMTISNHRPGALYVKLKTSAIIKICSFTATQFSTTPENCKHMAALAQQGFAQNSNMTIYIDNAPTTVCGDIPNWFAADVRYFAMSK